MSRISSRAERNFIIEGCNLGLRYDGRDSNAYRSIKVENSVLPHVNGSARVIVDGSSDVLCAIKLEITEPDQKYPELGKLIVNVDMSPSCDPYVEDRAAQANGAQIAEQLRQTLLTSKGIDLKQFGILNGLFCWAVHIDLLVLQQDGNPIDVCSIATYVALACTTIPATEAIPGESGQMEDFDVSGDVSDGVPVAVAAVPLVVTIAKVGNALLVDSSAQEQDCAGCVASLAYDREGRCCGTAFQKPGMLSLEDLSLCQEKASTVASAIYKHLDAFHERRKATTAGTAEKGVKQALHADMPQARLGFLL